MIPSGHRTVQKRARSPEWGFRKKEILFFTTTTTWNLYLGLSIENYLFCPTNDVFVYRSPKKVTIIGFQDHLKIPNLVLDKVVLFVSEANWYPVFFLAEMIFTVGEVSLLLHFVKSPFHNVFMEIRTVLPWVVIISNFPFSTCRVPCETMKICFTWKVLHKDSVFKQRQT